MSRVLLIDGDEFAFRAVSACTKGFKDLSDPDDPIWLPYCSEDEATVHSLTAIDSIQKELDADEIILTFTDKTNFRKEVDPSYKSNRQNGQIPLARTLGLDAVAANMEAEYGSDKTFRRPGLEADDCMGILATWPKFRPGAEKIIVSIDKDMKTIPGQLYRTGPKQLITVSQEEADLWFYAQSVAGDNVDGFSGVPGYGIKTALKYLESMTKPVSYMHTLTRGARKGEQERRLRAEPAESHWEIVEAIYQEAGLAPAIALTQARLARILRATDYDFKNRRPILWVPSTTGLKTEV